jgi:hypothetical protein
MCRELPGYVANCCQLTANQRRRKGYRRERHADLSAPVRTLTRGVLGLEKAEKQD